MARRALFGTLALACCALLGVGATIGAGDYLSAPARSTVGAPPPSLHASPVSIPTLGGPIAGWLAPGARSASRAGSVLLLHGVRGNRLQMLGRAQFLARLGYSVLLIDLQAHGESAGDHITFGAREVAGVTAALDYLERVRPGEPIGVIGSSLGAAAVVLARPGKRIGALVIEAMYPTIDEAVQNRLTMYGARRPGCWRRCCCSRCRCAWM